MSKKFLYTTCSPHVLSLEFSSIELVSQGTIFCHIVDVRINASDKDLPVQLELGVQICHHVDGHLILDPTGWLICTSKISRLPRNQNF